MSIEELSFEKAFDELKRTVEQLEVEDLPLEIVLSLFERGTILSRHCEMLLEQAELRVKQLVPSADGDGFDLTPFDEL